MKTPEKEPESAQEVEFPQNETAATALPEQTLPKPPENQPHEQPEPEAPAAVTPEEVERLVAEAEQRGYLRGRNEQAREMMERPALLENPLVRPRDEGARPKEEAFAARFLTRLRGTVWD